MRHVTAASWSNQDSFVHRLDARVKLILLLALVLSLALLRALSLLQFACCLAFLAWAAWTAGLPVVRLFRLSLIVVPFVGLFSLIVYLTGDGLRAWLILGKSYLSALAVLVCVSATPMPQLLQAAQFFHVPTLLLEVTQVVYRYLFVLGAQARAMQTAFRSRAGRPGRRAIQASSGMIAVLFSKSYLKAGMVHHAMLCRGSTGALPGREFPRLKFPELAILGAGLLLTAALHFI